MSNWQPIETAPHVDGQSVLLWGPWVTDHVGAWQWHEADRCWYCTCAAATCWAEGPIHGPTYWHPLPEPPSADGKPERP